MASYTVSPNADGTFTVEVRYQNGTILGQIFKSEAEANAWGA
jgi:hypothetical protein